MTAERKTFIFLALIIAAVALIGYTNTLHHGYVWDDNTVITANPLFDHLSNIPRFFLLEDHADVKTGYYRPITYASFALERSVWGMNSVGLNIDNLLLHTLVAVLFYRVVWSLFKRYDLAFIAALLFALHPIGTETVNFHAGGRNTLLCAIFALLSFNSYINRRILAATLWFGLGIFSKEFALLLPIFFFLYDRTLADTKVRAASYLPFVGLTACYLWMRACAVEAHGNLLYALQLRDRLIFVPSIIVTYLGNLVFPFHLKTIYSFNTQTAPDALHVAVDSLIMSALIACGFFFSHRREIVFSVSLFLVFLLPVLNLVPLGSFIIADRYAYLAAFGFCLAISYLICLTGAKPKAAITLALCAIYFSVVVTRNGYWKDDISFFTQMIKDAPNRSLGYQDLGYDYYKANDFINAAKYLELANEQQDQPPAYLVANADLFLDMNLPLKALASLRKELELQPADAEARFMAGRIYQDLGDVANAKLYFEQAARQQPNVLEAVRQQALSVCKEGEESLTRQNVPQEERRFLAERSFKKALRMDPRCVPALIDLGDLYGEIGLMDDAIREFQAAAAIAPTNPVPLRNLALAYKLKGRTADYERLKDKLKTAETEITPNSGGPPPPAPSGGNSPR